MTEAKTIIGLEIHVQLDTKSKLFCSCSTSLSEPNTHTCPTCLGLPGAKPVLNKRTVDLALKLALALNCKVNKEFFFSRKTYFYPDLPNSFQITQYEIPIGEKGEVILKSDKKIRITRIHLEEDPGALIHENNYSLIDYNRSGMPLVEIVTEPDIDSPKEARLFLDELITIINYLDVHKFGENVLKVDSNISLKGGERVEIKNITGFRDVEKALSFEEMRQRTFTKSGQKIERETRGYDAKTGSTSLMRKKETEEDYGYIFEPNLPVIEIANSHLERIKSSLPEMHTTKAERFVKQYKLEQEESFIISSDLTLANLFEEVAKKADAKLASQFLRRELLSVVNYDNYTLKDLELNSKDIIELLNLLSSGKISEKVAKEATIKYINEKIPPAKFIKDNNLFKDVSGKEIESIIDKILKENKTAFEELKQGNKKSLNFLIGLIMRETKGKAEAREVQKLIQERLK